MKKYLSPGNLIVTAGGILAFVGMTAYFTDSVNLSVPTFFYGVPIFLIGLGLKTSEIPPVELFDCLLYTSPSPRDKRQSRMPSSA